MEYYHRVIELKCKELSKSILSSIKEETKLFIQKENRAPGLAVILVGNNSASKSYVKSKTKRAEELGATYIMASHVFPTACKKDLPPIRPETVRAICEAVSIPVYALGGITPQTIKDLHDVPVTGVALMSGLMTCPDVPDYVRELKAQAK